MMVDETGFADVEKAMTKAEMLVQDLAEDGIDGLAIASAFYTQAVHQARLVLGDDGLKKWLEALQK